MLAENLIKIICCPNCQGDLKQITNKLVCENCNKEYIIKDGIPVLLIDYI